MFPFCHLRDPDLTGSSVQMNEMRSGGQPYGLSFRGPGRAPGSCGVGEIGSRLRNPFMYISAGFGQVECVARMLPSMPVCTQACVVSLCIFGSRKVCVCTQV